ncbi:MAG: phosphodiester glycosidase family protein [Firmicutes bacterium]|nr:phosphodiester glycosidase family protein [Bacillota bacterium]
MKKHLRKLTITVVIIMTLLFSTVAPYAATAGAGTTVYENVKDLGNGFTYTNTISQNSSYGREESYMTETTIGSSIKPIVIACDTIYGGLTLDKVVSYAKGLGYNVLGGINTDFFSTDTKVPLGIVVEDGIYKSSGDGYSSVTFDDAGRATINGSTLVNIKLTNMGGGTPPEPEVTETPDAGTGEVIDGVGGADGEAVDSGSDTAGEPAEEVKVWPASNAGTYHEFSHFNKMRVSGGGLYLFDSSFSTVSTRTSGSGWFVKMKVLDGEMTTSGTMTLKVEEKIETTGAISIEPGYMYLTADDLSYIKWRYDQFYIGDIVQLQTSCNIDAVKNCTWATGGGDILIKDGKVTDSSKWNKSIAAKNPRTALGIKEDGSVIYYTVDGRSSSYSNGLTLSQLAEELLALGCVSAINFDGGGSTVMTLQLPGNATAVTLNTPSDGSQRKCATYILFVNEKASDGVAKKLYIKQDGKLVYTGSKIALDYTAIDSGNATVSVPDDVKATVSGGTGSISGNVYTAGTKQGMENISLSSASKGISGTGQIFVVTDLSSIVVKAGSSWTSSIGVERGDTISLTPAATYNGENVIIDDSAFTFSVDPALGTISKNGVLKVSDSAPSGESWVKVTAGGITKTIKVTVAGVFSDIADHWAKNYITSLFEKGIVNGTDGKYMPENNIKRGDFILMLYRAAGQPAGSAASGFADVPADMYYAKAISWAKAQGIAMGDGQSFHPESGLTREQAFAFIYRYFNVAGIDVTGGNVSVLASYADGSSVAEYAQIPTATLIEMGIVSGSDGLLSPTASLTRGQMAKILDMTLAA